MKYLSVCSGIEAATVAWHPLGWQPVAFAEIEPFPSAVLAHHYPNVPNLGDLTQFATWPDYAIDVLVGGTPCQSFSAAGLRKGLDDPRGNLMLTFGAVAARYRPRWIVWENVPGVLTSGAGRDFASLLGLLTGQRVTVPEDGWKSAGIVPGIASAYGAAWRVFDAQYFGLAQRRQRVFVVGCAGNWRAAAAVLFELEGLRGDPAPSREQGQRAAATVTARARSCSPTAGSEGRLIADPVSTRPYADRGPDSNLIPFDPTQITHPENRSNPQPGGPCHTLPANGSPPAVAFKASHFTRDKDGAPSEVAPPLSADADKGDQDTLLLAPVAYRTSGSDGAWETGDKVDTLTTNVDSNSHIVAFRAAGQDGFTPADVTPPLVASDGGGTVPTIAFTCKDHGQDAAADVAPTLRAMGGDRANGGGQVAVTVPAEAVGVILHGSDGTTSTASYAETAGALMARTPGQVENGSTTVVFQTRIARNGRGQPSEIAPALTGADAGATSDMRPCVASPDAVRRLTPLECERLQGFPDNYTLIPGKKRQRLEQELLVYLQSKVPGLTPEEAERLAADAPRYKALGNSMARPVMEWLGRQIQAVHAILLASGRGGE